MQPSMQRAPGRRVPPPPARRGMRGLALACLLALAACGDPPPADAPSTALARVGAGPHDVAVIRVKEKGAIRVELYPEIAPETVENFTRLAESGFYDGTTFHRVIPGFMIQGGDPESKNPDPRRHGKGGPGYAIADEFTDFPHERGVVSMANRGPGDSGGSQFFICHADRPELDGGYAVFGRVIEGMDVVDAITEMELDEFGRYGPFDRPYPEDARVESIQIERAPTRSERAGHAEQTDSG